MLKDKTNELHALKVEFTAHSKNRWVVLTQLWVKYGQNQSLGLLFITIFNPTVCPYLTQSWVKQPSDF